MKSNNTKGFTLLELLIVITIIAVLSVILIVALNPVETLRKARDTQRLSDLSSLKTALGIYTTTKTSPYLAGAASNTACQATTGTYASGDLIYYSLHGTGIDDAALDGGSVSVPDASQVATQAELGEVDGTGWVPVNLASITGGSPISNMPIDPVNSVVQAAFAPAGSTDSAASTGSAMSTAALVYRYACASDNLTFEINAQLESIAFTSVTNGEDKRRTDGGDNNRLYEVGTDLTILGTGDDF